MNYALQRNGKKIARNSKKLIPEIIFPANEF